MLKIGITGGIGTGKSEVCKILEEFGATVLYADDIAKNILDSDLSVKSQVTKIFGNDIIDASGKIDKKNLARKIFWDENLKKRLENIIHPLVIDTILKKFEEISNKKSLAFVEAALIFETGFNKKLDYTIVIESEIETCVQRVIKRDSTTREDVLNRLKSQIDPKKKIQLADFVIRNNSTLDDLRKNVSFIYNLLLKLSEKPHGFERT